MSKALRFSSGLWFLLAILLMTGCGGGGGGTGASSAPGGGAPVPTTPNPQSSLQFGVAPRTRVTSEAIPSPFFNVPAQVGARAVMLPFSVEALDASGNPVSGVIVTLTLVNPQGATLGGVPVEATRTDGSPTFSDVTISLPGQYSLMATAPGFVSATSAPIAVLNTSANLGSPITVGSGPGPVGLVVADVNGDGLPDLVTASPGSDQVFVGLNLTAPPSSILDIADPVGFSTVASTTPAEPFAVAVSDVTGDGKPDLVIVNSLSSQLVVLPGE